MPRKRQARKERNVPQMPEGDEGKDLTVAERKQKLQFFLADFDRKFLEKKQTMEQKIELTMKRIDTYCQMGIQQIPKSLRKMKLSDFIDAGGTFESALKYLDKKENTEFMNDVEQENCSIMQVHDTFQKIATECQTALHELHGNQVPMSSQTSSSKQMTDILICPSTIKKPLKHLQEITDDDIDGMVTRTLRSTRRTNATSAQKVPRSTTVKKPLNPLQEMTDDDIDGMITQTLRSTRHTNATSALKVPRSTTVKKGSRLRSGGRPYETPMLGQLFPRNFKTPAITPKFDPRLPMTPFDRSPKVGERLMSIEGSPVVVRQKYYRKLEKVQEKINMVLVQENINRDAVSILTEVSDMLNESP